MNNICYNHLFYADDGNLIASSPRALQVLINCCQDFADKNELVFNVKKTKVMVFMPKSMANITVPNFKLKGDSLIRVYTQKYLGVILCEEQKDDLDIQRQIKSIYCKGNILIKRFKNCSDDVKIKLFKSYCTSFYCAQLWSRFKQESFRKLVTAYKRVYRNLMKLNYDTSITNHLVLNNADPVDVILRKLIFSMRSRLLNSTNILVNGIVSSMFYLDCSITKVWHERLFL